MEFIVLLAILFFSTSFYMFLTSYRFQIFWRKTKTKKVLIDAILPRVKGKYMAEGHFASSHKVLSKYEYNKLRHSGKLNFSRCYNVITFKTKDSDWEMFFYLVKEGMKFNEVLAIRAFPREVKIKSQATIEKTKDRVNVLANNKYLAQILESYESKELLRWMLNKEGDNFFVYNNNIFYKSIQHGNEIIAVDRALEIIKAAHNLKNRIYKKGILEY